MTKPNRRSMPSTPRPQSAAEEAGTEAVPSGAPASPARGAARRAAGAGSEVGAANETRPARSEPAYLIEGTGCVAGHARGRERDAGPIGELPSARTTWIGVGLLAWCGAGLYFLLDPRWMSLAVIGLLLWLAFSAFVQRRRGHRGKCWRTRAWRHAWGGLVPSRD